MSSPAFHFRNGQLPTAAAVPGADPEIAAKRYRPGWTPPPAHGDMTQQGAGQTDNTARDTAPLHDSPHQHEQGNGQQWKGMIPAIIRWGRIPMGAIPDATRLARAAMARAKPMGTLIRKAISRVATRAKSSQFSCGPVKRFQASTFQGTVEHHQGAHDRNGQIYPAHGNAQRRGG